MDGSLCTASRLCCKPGVVGNTLIFGGRLEKGAPPCVQGYVLGSSVYAMMYVGRCDAVDQEVEVSVMSCFGWDVFGNFLTLTYIRVSLCRMWRSGAVPLLSHFRYAEQATNHRPGIIMRQGTLHQHTTHLTPLIHIYSITTPTLESLPHIREVLMRIQKEVTLWSVYVVEKYGLQRLTKYVQYAPLHICSANSRFNTSMPMKRRQPMQQLSHTR